MVGKDGDCFFLDDFMKLHWIYGVFSLSSWEKGTEGKKHNREIDLYIPFFPLLDIFFYKLTFFFDARSDI